MLTGESIPVEAGPGFQTFAGALVRRGEAVAEVTATGVRTKFEAGLRNSSSMHACRQVHNRRLCLRVVQNLAMFNGALIVVLVGFAWLHAMPLCRNRFAHAHGGSRVDSGSAAGHVYTCGCRRCAVPGIIVKAFCRRALSAVDEAASIDVLCADKTGTLTRNELTVATVIGRFVRLRRSSTSWDSAAAASSDGGQDPVDAAIRRCRRSEQFLRFTETDDVCAVRSGDENVRGDSGGFRAAELCAS